MILRSLHVEVSLKGIIVALGAPNSSSYRSDSVWLRRASEMGMGLRVVTGDAISQSRMIHGSDLSAPLRIDSNLQRFLIADALLDDLQELRLGHIDNYHDFDLPQPSLRNLPNHLRLFSFGLLMNSISRGSKLMSIPTMSRCSFLSSPLYTSPTISCCLMQPERYSA